jgi:hypothetical protein
MHDNENQLAARDLTGRRAGRSESPETTKIQLYATDRAPIDGYRFLRVLSTGVAAAVLILVAGCSRGSSGPGVAGVASPVGGTSSPGALASPDLLAFARCMRAHGIADYPDSGALLGASAGTDLDPHNPAYQAAHDACRSLRPVASLNPAQQAQAYAADLKFAQCMRQHGIANFPDPQPNSPMIDRRQFDLNSPQFQAAQQACKQYLYTNGKGGQ